MKHSQDLARALGVSLPETYIKFLEKHENRLTDNPVDDTSSIKGLGTSHFVLGTTLAFRAATPKFLRHWIVIGYAGKKTIVINKVYEEIDDYVALDVRDGRVLFVDALGTAVEVANNFDRWISSDLKTTRLNELKRLLSRETKSNLTVLVFEDELKAEEARLKILKLQKQGFIDVEDAVVVSKQIDGTIKLHQAQKLNHRGVWAGSLTGLIVGGLIAMPVMGAVVGAVTGALAGSVKAVGIDESFVKELAEMLSAGSSAIFTLVRSADPDKVCEEFFAFGGTVLFSSVNPERAQEIQDILAASAQGAPPEIYDERKPSE